MKHYNRALDYTALALAQVKAGNGVLAARLLAKAGEQTDLTAAIAVLETSNAHAFALKAKTVKAAKARLKANEDDMAEDEGDFIESDMDADEFAGDPLEEVADVQDDMPEEEMTEEAPEVAMAKVLSKMVRKAGRK